MKNGYINEEYQKLKDGLIQIINSGKDKYEIICGGKNPKREDLMGRGVRANL